MIFSAPLKLNHIFRRLYHSGSQAGNRYMVVYCRKNHTAGNRVGFTVSKKLGKAVVRNRVRRRLREIYRLSEQHLLCGFDLVIVARGAAVDASYAQLDASFRTLAARLQLTRGQLP